MKKRLTVVMTASFVLASCGTQTIVREIQVTTPTSVAPVPTDAPSEDMTTQEAIAWIKTNAPSFEYETDADIYRLMNTACDTIDQWAPDYRGYLDNAWSRLAGENNETRNQIAAIIVGAISSICTRHKQSIMAALKASA